MVILWSPVFRSRHMYAFWYAIYKHEKIAYAIVNTIRIVDAIFRTSNAYLRVVECDSNGWRHFVWPATTTGESQKLLQRVAANSYTHVSIIKVC
jgi:hypothetical protein